jgi:small-conductance mechanosensitive channel
MQATWAVLAANATVLDRARSFLEQLTTTEGRAAVSVGIVLLTLVVALVAAPRLVRYLNRVVVQRLLSGRVARGLEVTGEYIPTTVSGLFVRSLQVVILLFAGVGLLVVWGLVDLAVGVLTVIGLSIPLAVKLVTTVALFLGTYVGSDVISDAVRRFSEGADRVTEHQEEIILRIGQLGLLALALAGSLTIWGVDLSGLLVGAGFLGIVVGLAARQTLGSLIAGLVLMFSRPFTIGDWVEIGGEQGIVTDITIFNTRLENFDGEFVVLPNDTVNNSAITNRSKKGHLRIRLDVGVDYDSDPEHAESVALEAVEGLESVLSAPAPQVIPKDFGDSAVVLEVRFWIDRPTPPRMWRARADVVTAVKEAFAAEGIQIPFPQRTVSGRGDAAGISVHDQVGDGERPEPADDQRADGE